MTSIENLYYAFGEIAYAIAVRDGDVQKSERQEFIQIINDGLSRGKAQLDISRIIFHILDKQKASLEQTYLSAMKELKQNSHYLSPEMKEDFITVIEKIASACPPVTADETRFLEMFRRDIEALRRPGILLA